MNENATKPAPVNDREERTDRLGGGGHRHRLTEGTLPRTLAEPERQGNDADDGGRRPEARGAGRDHPGQAAESRPGRDGHPDHLRRHAGVEDGNSYRDFQVFRDARVELLPKPTTAVEVADPEELPF